MSQTLSPRTKILLALAALLLLAGGHFVVRQWRAGQQPAAETVVQTDCDPRQGCPLPNGSRIRFAAARHRPFDITLENVPPQVQQAEVSSAWMAWTWASTASRFSAKPTVPSSPLKSACPCAPAAATATWQTSASAARFFR